MALASSSRGPTDVGIFDLYKYHNYYLDLKWTRDITKKRNGNPECFMSEAE
jgi:hypothetical protein